MKNLEFQKLLVEYESKYKKNLENTKTFLDITGYPHLENVYSNILAFYFDVNEEHELGSLFIRSLLEVIGEKCDDINEVSVSTEVRTAKGKRIDLLIYNEDLAIGIENKVFSWLYNDLQDYSKKINSIKSKNKYKIVLSVFDESSTANKYGFKNVKYSELFRNVEKNGEALFDKSNKWHIFLKEFIKKVDDLVMKNMDNDTLEWVKNNKSQIEDFNQFLCNVKEELNSKAKTLNTFLERENLDKYLWIHNANSMKNGLYTTSVIEKIQEELAIDNIITLEGWQVDLVSRRNIQEVDMHIEEIKEKLEKSQIEYIKKDEKEKWHLIVKKFDFNESYENIINFDKKLMEIFA